MEMETTTKVFVEKLRLDLKNPRLFGLSRGSSEESVIAWLYRAADLRELLESISVNGYLDIEPLVVTREPKSDKLIVLEGNRRLAALRLLRDPELAARIESLERLKVVVPPMTDELLRATLDRISVYPVANRENARSFIGFKHINGPAKWDAYAKARFAAEWYKAQQPAGGSLEDIATAIGDRHDTIKRMVFAIYVLDQANDNNLFNIEDRNTAKFNFSHLYTALSRSQYMQYLDLGETWAKYDPAPDPVPSHKLEKLRKVLVWIYGSKTENQLPIVRSQNPDIKRLGEVLAHAEALHILEVTCDLNAAHASAESVDIRFTASLIRARDAVRDTANSLRAYDGKDRSLLDIAEDVKVTADTIFQSMSGKHHKAGTGE